MKRVTKESPESPDPDQKLCVLPQVLQAQSRTPQPGKRVSLQGRSRCASMDQVLSSRYSDTCRSERAAPELRRSLFFSVRPAMIRSELRSALRRCPTEEEAGSSEQPVGQLQSLIAQRMQRAQELLEEMRLQVCRVPSSGVRRSGGRRD